MPKPDAPLRVLVTGGCPDLVEVLCASAGQRGYEVRTADGPAALELARRCRPHVVLLGRGLSRPGALDLAWRLRALPELREALFVALTATQSGEGRTPSAWPGIHWFLADPPDTGELAALLAARAAGCRIGLAV